MKHEDVSLRMWPNDPSAFDSRDNRINHALSCPGRHRATTENRRRSYRSGDCDRTVLGLVPKTYVIWLPRAPHRILSKREERVSLKAPSERHVVHLWPSLAQIQQRQPQRPTDRAVRAPAVPQHADS